MLNFFQKALEHHRVELTESNDLMEVIKGFEQVVCVQDTEDGLGAANQVQNNRLFKHVISEMTQKIEYKIIHEENESLSSYIDP